MLEVIEKKPEFHEAYYNFAIVFYAEKNYIMAKEYAEKAVAIQPDNAESKSYWKSLLILNHLAEEHHFSVLKLTDDD